MKKILIVLMILFSATAHAQLYQSMPQPGYYFNRGWFEGLLTIPTNATQLSNITGGRDVGRIRYNIPDSSFQVYTGYQWLAGNRSTGANTALSNLASVAINESLLPGTTDAIDLGSASKQWRSIYLPNTDNSSTLGVIFKGGNRFFHNFKLTGTDGENTFMGNLSGNFTMTGSSGIQGSYNTGYGVATLYSNTTGFRNAAFGTYALQNNTTGFSNNAFGQSALFLNTTGFNNSAIGTRALNFNTTGTSNSAHGTDAGFANTTGSFNFFGCIDAGYQNTTGSYNTYVGDSTFWIGTIGIKNTGIGSRAGYYLGDTYPNFASVKDSMVTFLGADASRDSSVANTTALKNLTVIGYNAKGYASNQMSFGNEDVTSNIFRGAFRIKTYGSGTHTGTPTYSLQVDANGNLIEGTQNLQFVTNVGNTTTNDIQFDDGITDYTIIGTTTGNGYFKFRSSTNANNAIFANNNLTADRTYTLPNSSGTFPLGTGTSNEITYWSGANTIGSLTTATYPSLTELSYVKGLSSSAQTQINGKQATITFGTGVQTALGVNVGSAGAPVLFNGALGTPSSGTLTNATGLPEGGLSTTDITTNNTTTSKHGFFPKLTANSIYYVNNGGSLTALTVGAAGTMLNGNGVTSAPTWGTVTEYSEIVDMDGLSGTLTITTAGIYTLTNPSGGDNLINLPSAASNTGKTIWLINAMGSAGTYNTNAPTNPSASSFATIPSGYVHGMKSNGSAWIVVTRYDGTTD